MSDSLTYACLPSCDEEGQRGLDCHECGHSLNCAFCCSNDDGPSIKEERATLYRAWLDREDYGSDDDEDGGGWALPPHTRRGKLRFMKEKCSTCIFRPGNKMTLDPGRVASMLAAVRADDSYIPCHKTLGTGLPSAICKGGDDAHEGQIARIGRRIGADVYVTEEEVLAEIAARETATAAVAEMDALVEPRGG